MVNSADFSKRLEQIMERHELNASSFAEQIGVGRSSISHILSGRNKPSLDFVLSILKQFPDVDLYWLLNGKGTYPRTEGSTNKNSNLVNGEADSIQQLSTTTDSNDSVSKASPVLEEKVTSGSVDISDSKKGKNVTKVILIYDDGTFESFNS